MTDKVPTQSGFDYSQLSSADRKFVQGVVNTIHRLRGKAVVDMGEQLVKLKNYLERGLYLKVLKEEWDWSERSTQNFVAVFERFGRAANFADVSRHIQVSAQYVLAAPSTPQAAVDEALAKAEAGERVTHQAAKAIVAKHKAPAPAPATRKSEPPEEDGADDDDESEDEAEDEDDEELSDALDCLINHDYNTLLAWWGRQEPFALADLEYLRDRLNEMILALSETSQ